ncbi:hypothetical protein CHELA1G11_20826 [Hyphomicrobiales bacterium]|nr:hypothetical protein CHELA1G11_20826 [Hyphomicrobiales bacterium]CAH1692133.1 hypothetical protein CHELA1G2_21142 [Hyphomicrobiales bacterium]
MILENKLVVVTGGASGIGEACVRRCARRGATVVVADCNEAAGAVAMAFFFAGNLRDAWDEPNNCARLNRSIYILQRE